MQKKIIALAVAGLMSGAAFAQSNVTISGRLDAMYEHTSATGGQKSNKLDSGGLGGSRLTFSGTEDMGGGLKAVFMLDLNLNADGNTGAAGESAFNGITNARNVYIGLAGNWGTLLAGRLNSPGMDAAIKYDATAASVFGPVQSFGRSGVINGGTIQAAGRLNNTVAYVSPSMSGLTLTAAYSFAGATGEVVTGGTTGIADQETIVGLRADYSVGPMNVGFVHHRIDDRGNVTGVNNRENLLGASYNFGVATLVGSYQTGKSNAAGRGTDKLWAIGGIIPVGSGDVRVQYAKFNDNDTATAANDASGWGVQYNHNLSKRTTAYAGYQRIDNKGAGTIRTIMGDATPTAGGNSTGYGIGLRHMF
jgi:predicted porin